MSRRPRAGRAAPRAGPRDALGLLFAPNRAFLYRQAGGPRRAIGMRRVLAVAGCLLLLMSFPGPSVARADPGGRDAGSGPAGASGQVVVTAGVEAVRLLVVDDRGGLLQVWSNTDGPAELHARRGSRAGPAVAVTEGLHAAYEQIAPTIPPGARGLVYERPRQ